MTQFNFLVPVVCNDIARIKVDIPEELIPKFKKFLTSNTQISWVNVEKFLKENDLENDSEGVHVVERVEQSCQEFDSSDLHWEPNDFAKVDFENEEYEDIDLERDWALKALAEVQESGATNMLDRLSVVEAAASYGWEDEADFIEQMDNIEYINLLIDLSNWINI